MGASQRTKGANGEREVAALLSNALGLPVARNWREQFFGGAFDLTGVPGWAVEVKRAKKENRLAWWQQTLQQAEKSGLKPALLFRVDGQGRGLEADEKWQVLIPLGSLHESIDKTTPVQMSLRVWIYLLARGTWQQ